MMGRKRNLVHCHINNCGWQYEFKVRHGKMVNRRGVRAIVESHFMMVHGFEREEATEVASHVR